MTSTPDRHTGGRGPGRRRPLSAAGAVCALVVVQACASSHGAAFTRAMREADDAVQAGDRREGARRFDVAAGLARTARDRGEAMHAAARLLARSGDAGAALERLDALAREPSGAEAASALYDAACLRLDAGDDAGWANLEEVVLRFPNDGSARPALHRSLAHHDETGGPGASLTWLRAHRAALDATDRAEEVAYETAVRLDRTGTPDEARRAFHEVAARWPYPQGALWDDALVHASALAEAAGDFQGAVDDLESMLARRERAMLVGSAERPTYAPAQLHVAELYRDRLHDASRARGAFHRLATSFPESTLRDRALWQEAEMLRATGDVAGSCARLRALAREIPASRFVPCARAMCPDIPAPDAGHATATCHPYLQASTPAAAVPGAGG